MRITVWPSDPFESLVRSVEAELAEILDDLPRCAPAQPSPRANRRPRSRT